MLNPDSSSDKSYLFMDAWNNLRGKSSSAHLIKINFSSKYLNSKK